MRRFLLPALLAAIAPPATAAVTYDLDYDATSESMRVRLCVAEAAAHRRFALDRGATRYIDDLKRDGDRALERDANGWRAADWQAGECLRYRAAIGRIADRHENDVGSRVGRDLLTAPQQWLMQPVDVAGGEVTLRLPDGVRASVPWTPLPDVGGAQRFAIPPAPRGWAAYVALGDLREQRIDAPGGTVRLTLLGDATPDARETVRAWIGDVARAAVSAYGELPLPHVQVLLLPGRRGDAVGFGQSMRGQGQALMLLVDAGRPASEFRDDWTAVHELAHLFHPYLGDDGRWLSEGLASYWQNVLRARAGLLAPAEAWRRLDAGFERGRADARAGTSLAQLTRRMHEEGAYMRIYWAGAAYWLRVDTELRQASGGRLSVELALRRFRDCCIDDRREWSPAEFVGRLDALLGVDVFAARYREFAAQATFPDLASLYSDLGLERRGREMHLRDDAPLASVRDAIMQSPRGTPH